MKFPTFTRFWQFRNVGLSLRTIALIAAIVLSLSAATLASIILVFRTNAAEELVSHTFEVQRQAYELMNAALNSETGIRGFLLTDDPSFLAPYNRATSRQSVIIDHLRKLTEDNPAQQEHLTSINAAMRQLFEQYSSLLSQSKNDRSISPGALSLLHATKSQMDVVRALIAEFANIENALLAERRSTASRLRVLLSITMVGALITAFWLALILGHTALEYIDRLDFRTAELENEIKRRREVEITLAQSQKMEAIGQLSGGIAHDFNNMLTVIIGNLDTLSRRLERQKTANGQGESTETLKRPVGLAMQGARNAARLTQRLLAFARRQPLVPSVLDLNAVVRNISELLRRTIGETMEFETVFGAGLWPTFADSNQLENVLVNLVVNARDAMPDGGKVTIETSNVHIDDAYARRFGDIAAGQYVMLGVTDSGTGMSPEVLDRVFEPFFTTKKGGAGSGLGLAMVHGFVKQSGGHIRVYSEVGQGTTVRIYLPRHISTTEAAATPIQQVSNFDDVPIAQNAEIILLVEDDDDVRVFAQASLEELGYVVISEANGVDATRVIESGTRFDLLFTDVVLSGGMNGRELAQLASRMRPGVPILFTTGYTRNAIVHNGKLDPDVELLAKPYSQIELAHKLRKMLGRVSPERS